MKSSKSIIRGTIGLTTIILLLVALPGSTALAYSDGPRNANAGTNVSTVGTEPWLNPGNITTAGSPYAEVTLYHLHLVSNYLQGTNYGFAIPSDATITGIEVLINRMANTGVLDNEVRLVKAGTPAGDNKANGVLWPATLESVTYGSPSDLWGTTWTPADINSVDFGAAISALRTNNGNNSRSAVVDTMQITVSFEYTTETEVVCGSGVPITYGDNVTCVATITRLAGSGTPGGSVNWTTDGTGSFDPNPCDLSGTGGVASCSVTYTPSAVGDGSHLITASYSGDPFFTPSSASQYVSVVKRPVTVTADPQTKVYGDPDPELAYQVSSGSLVFTDTFTGTLLRESGENVGTYAIWQGTLALTDNYDLAYVGNDLTIKPADATCLVDGYTGVYDAAFHGASGTCSGVDGENPGVLDLGESFVNVPGGTATWAFTGNGNYYDQDGEVAVVIDPADATCLVDGYTGVYDAAFHGASGSCTGVDDENPGVLDLGESFVNVPGGTATWTFTGNGNYLDQDGEVDVVIDPADATCLVGGYTGVYDAAFHGASGSCTGVDGENPGVLDLGESFVNVPGGTATWTLTGNGNYYDQDGELAIEISKANPTCEVTGYSLEYDRESHTASGACLGVDGNPLDGLDLSSTTHTDIGTYVDDPWAFTDLGGNYNNTNGNVNNEITQRFITIAADAKGKFIGQADPELTFQVTVGWLLDGDAFSGELTREPGENIGTYAILQGLLSLPDYYRISFESATFTIGGYRYILPMIRNNSPLK